MKSLQSLQKLAHNATRRARVSYSHDGRRRVLCALLLLCAPLAWADDVTVVSLFPSDTLTVTDDTQATGLRVNLPLPDCNAEPSTCAEITALNQLDGFSINPRIAIRFSGPIDPNAARSAIFLAPADAPFEVTSINQIIYDPATFTLYAKPDQVLDPRRQYRLTVSCSTGLLTCASPVSTTFTTLSATTWLDRARANLPNTAPLLAPNGTPNVYKLSDIRTFTVHQQNHANPSAFQDLTLPVSLLFGVDRIAFGSFQSPTYLNAQQSIDALPTATDPGPGRGTNQIYFHALLPSQPKPPAGYPVIIYGHGLGDSQWGGPSVVAPIMALSGFAVISINAVGHGYGPESSIVMGLKNGQQVQLPAGGRSIPDSSGAISSSAGCILVTSGAGIRDCLRQTAIDLMQLVRAIKSGIDDVDANRIYYVGQSLGSLYGTLLTALEPDLPVAALNVGGGSAVDISRWSPAFQSLVKLALATRQPALLNAGNFSYNENYVLRDQPVKINDVPGAIDIQDYFERLDWANAAGDPLAYAPLLRGAPFAGLPAKKILFLFAIGDRTVPNPTESALVRAANMSESTWIFRNDLARVANANLPADPHAYLTNILSGGAAASIALATQSQIAAFFASNGAKIPDPNVPGLNYFEIPMKLPETLGFP
jgi:pimeloyl-ACP methyl ester carboxylesterase